jgi:hypothetical protein
VLKFISVSSPCNLELMDVANPAGVAAVVRRSGAAEACYTSNVAQFGLVRVESPIGVLPPALLLI